MMVKDLLQEDFRNIGRKTGLKDQKIRKLVEEAEKNGSRILDVGTGTGKQAFAFAKKGYDVTGIDLSEAMLKVANKKNNYEDVKFTVADASNLPFKDSSFDVSGVSFALYCSGLGES